MQYYCMYTCSALHMQRYCTLLLVVRSSSEEHDMQSVSTHEDMMQSLCIRTCALSTSRSMYSLHAEVHSILLGGMHACTTCTMVYALH